MLTVRRLTPETIAEATPIADAVLVGEETVVRIGRTGFTLAWSPLDRARWHTLPQRADADAELLCGVEDAAVFGAFVDGQFVGMACMYAAYDGWAELCDLRVDAQHRRQGVATALVASCEHLARQRGLYGLRCVTSDQNPTACRFLLERNFTLQGMDRMALAGSPEERAKPLMHRACSLIFYRR
ncbi:MAG: GNAT family N-acetyltransferase [Clostridia bacterium]|nr:GNAT family N-acetyltransferase [Clostridia bacterium]